MATDFDAREITLNYDGGALTMVVGNAKDLFGEDNDVIEMIGEQMEVPVKEHNRVRKIGKGSKKIERFTRSYIQWPSNGRSNAAGGTPVMMNWTGSDGEWTARCTGPLWKLGRFLNTNSPKSVWFYAKGGRGYGPFQKV